MKINLQAFTNVISEKIRTFFQIILQRKENILKYDFDNNYLDEEIEQKNRRVDLFNKEIGLNPLIHIDWIIENGLVEYNEKYQYFISGDYEREKEIKRMEVRTSEWQKLANVLADSTRNCGMTLESQEVREINLNLEQVMDFHSESHRKESKRRKSEHEALLLNLSRKDRRYYINKNKIEEYECIEEIRGGMGNKRIAVYKYHVNKRKSTRSFLMS